MALNAKYFFFGKWQGPIALNNTPLVVAFYVVALRKAPWLA